MRDGNGNGSTGLRDRPITELVKHLAEDVSTLVHQEIELGKAELTQKVEETKQELVTSVQDVKSVLVADTRRATDELAENGKTAGIALGLWSGAAVLGLATFGVLTAFFVMALDTAMPGWLAALVVTLVYAAIAGALFMLGRQRMHQATPLLSPETSHRITDDLGNAFSRSTGRVKETLPPVPEQTIETLKEDIEWVKHPTRSGAR
jgi:hypothetical protein